MHEFCGDSAVDTTADCPNYSPLRPTDFADARDFFADELFLEARSGTISSVLTPSGYYITDHCPVCRTVTDVENELSDDFSPSWGVGNLGVELDTVPWLIVVSDGCEGCSGGMPDDVEISGDFGELVPMGHPDL